MRIEFSRRAAADVRAMAEKSLAFGPDVARAIERRLLALIDHVAAHLLSMP
jgi:plasmid stabilization system protein ParE